MQGKGIKNSRSEIAWKIVFYIFITFFFYYEVHVHLNPILAGFSFFFSYISIHTIEKFILRPYQALKSYTHKRIQFNLETSGLKAPFYKHIILAKVILFFSFFVILVGLEAQPYLLSSTQWLMDNLSPTRSFLTIKHQAFQNSKPTIIELTEKQQDIVLQSSDFIQLTLEHASTKTPWQIKLQDTQTNQQEETSQLELSAQSLFQTYNSHPIVLVLTNGKKEFRAQLIVHPLPKPIVTLKNIPPQFRPNEKFTQKLGFMVHVNSEIDLTSVLLSMRTKSGFHFEQILAEFSNQNQKNFDLPYTDLVTAGIPFQEDDILYVKAIAKTPVTNQIGESIELVFPIESPTKIKKELITELEKAQEKLKSAHSFSLEEKVPIKENLSKSKELSSKINPEGMITKKIEKLETLLEYIEKPKDVVHKQSLKEIKQLIDMLKMQVAKQKSMDLIYQIQKLKQNLDKALSLKQDTTPLTEQTKDLAKEVPKLMDQLQELKKQYLPYLSPEDKKQLEQYFQQDTTEKELTNSAQQLEKEMKKEAQDSINKADESARKNIIGILKLLHQGRQKSLDKATQKEEDDMEKEEEQQAENMRNHRSSMDTIAAQGMLDQSFRKNILDNITRLKKEGKPENNKMIEYLESQLK